MFDLNESYGISEILESVNGLSTKSDIQKLARAIDKVSKDKELLKENYSLGPVSDGKSQKEIKKEIDDAFSVSKDRKLGREATVEDIYNLNRKQSFFLSPPSQEQICLAALGLKSKDSIITSSKMYGPMMGNVILYTLHKKIKTNKIFDFEQVKAIIEDNLYVLNDGCRELKDVEIDYGKTIQIPSSYLFLVVQKSNKNKKIIFSFSPDWQGNYTILVKSDGKETIDTFFEWLEAQVKENNFLKKAKIDANGKFIRIDKSIGWDSIVLDKKAKQQIEQNILSLFKNEHIYKANGIPAKRGFALVGPPGTGKTLLAKILASKLSEVTFIWVTPSCLYNPTAIGNLYSLAQELAPSIVFIEDADIYLAQRGSYESQGGILTELMNRLDGITPIDGVVTGISTNRPEVIENALINRPGRFDVKIYLGPPDAIGRFDLLSKYLSKVNFDPKDIKKIIDDSRIEKFTGCMLAELAKRAIMNAIDDGRYDKKSYIANVNADDLLKGIGTMSDELKMGGDFNKSPVIKAEEEFMPISSVSENVSVISENSSRKLLEFFDKIGKKENVLLERRAKPAEIRNIIKTQFSGEEENDEEDVDNLEFDKPIYKMPGARRLLRDLLSNRSMLRRMGVNDESIDSALDRIKNRKDKDVTLRDLVIALTGRD